MTLKKRRKYLIVSIAAMFTMTIFVLLDLSISHQRTVHLLQNDHSGDQKIFSALQSNNQPSSDLLKPIPQNKVRLRVLTYHHIAEPPDGRQNSYYVPPANFDAQMNYIQSQGYRTITPDEFYNDLTAGKSDDKAVLITFDDGNLDNYTNAFSTLKKYNFTGTFFVVSRMLNKELRLTSSQVIEMDKAGMTIGSHSQTHPDLTKVTSDQLASEVAGSKNDLEQLLGHSVNYFAYPGGSQNSVVQAAVEAAGYKAAFGIRHSIDHNPANLWNINRVHIDDDMQNIIDRLQGKNF